MGGVLGPLAVEVEQDGVGGLDGLDGASQVAVSPDGAHVYVAAFNDDAVTVFRRDASTGRLSFEIPLYAEFVLDRRRITRP